MEMERRSLEVLFTLAQRVNENLYIPLLSSLRAEPFVACVCLCQSMISPKRNSGQSAS